MTRLSVKRLDKVVADFNAAHPVGTAVEYHRHRHSTDPAPLTTVTRSEAWVLSGHTAVVLIEAVAGCVALDALRPVGVAP